MPNYYDPFQRDRLTEGLVLTIEPLIAARPSRVRQDRDGWTLRTHNGALAAHYEHTLRDEGRADGRDDVSLMVKTGRTGTSQISCCPAL